MTNFTLALIKRFREGDVKCESKLQWCLRVQEELRPLPCPSDADRAGEFIFGRLELGGPTSSRFSAIVVILSSWLLKFTLVSLIT